MNVEEPVRKPQFAGRFLPVEAEEQRGLLEGWVTPVSSGPRAAGLVLPHGPWSDIGPLVGAALSSTRLEEVVVLLAPNHLCRGPRATIVSEGTFVLPTGNVPIDNALAESLRALGGLTELPEVLGREHAIEVLLPLLSRPSRGCRSCLSSCTTSRCRPRGESDTRSPTPWWPAVA
ncbi:MAG: AmmeMemoRadiSam system protein B [Myxococcales bacterium]|nr:AmmeMemoRadiSam system protein B [Myxococcales bacterium]